MAATFILELLAPDRPAREVRAEEIVLPGDGGILSILPGHTPLLTTIRPGLIEVRRGESIELFAVAAGFADVGPERVAVIADAYEPGTEIDIERVARARTRAEERLGIRGGDHDVARAEAALQRALAREQAHQGDGYGW